MKQLSCWALFHLSFSLKVIAVLHLGPWNFRKLQTGPLLLPPACSPASRADRQRRPPPAAQGRPRATSCLLASTRHAQAPCRPLPFALVNMSCSVTSAW